MDQCRYCLAKGNLGKCLDTECIYHELWMVKELKRITQFKFDKNEKESANAPVACDCSRVMEHDYHCSELDDDNNCKERR